MAGDEFAQEALYAQDSEFRILEALLPFIENRVFIDIGAEKGLFAGFLISKGFSGVLFEPYPDHAAHLKYLVEGTDSVFYPYAIDRRDGHREFYLACDEDGNLMDYYHSLHYMADDPRVRHRQNMQVECRSLSSLLREEKISGQVGVLKIDTEGNDLQVIKGMQGVVPEILICEFFTEGLYEGWHEADPEGLISEVAAVLGYSRYIAVKRYLEDELISFSPSVFWGAQWGNLIFLSDAVYDRAFHELADIVRFSEKRLLSAASASREASRGIAADLKKQLNGEIEMLRRVCEERLQLIEHLSREAEKRDLIIRHLEKQLKSEQ